MAKSVEPKSEKLKSVYSKNRSVEDQRKIYRDWAQTYDDQTTGEFGWMGFKSAANEFALRVTDKQARILDAGCGTGLSGAALANLGYTNLHGMDLSPEMLAMAESRNIYKALGEVDLTKPLEIEQQFDAVIAVGVFGFGPPHPEHLPHLVHAAKPGAPVMITVNGKGWADMGWETRLPAVIAEHGLNLEEQVEIDYLEKEEIRGKLLVFRA